MERIQESLTLNDIENFKLNMEKWAKEEFEQNGGHQSVTYFITTVGAMQRAAEDAKKAGVEIDSPPETDGKGDPIPKNGLCMGVIPAYFPDPKDVGDEKAENAKEQYSELVRMTCEKFEVYALCFISEVWMSEAPKDTAMDKETGEIKMPVLPRNDPNRIEGLMINIETRMRTSSKMWEIDRSGDKPVLKEKHKWNDDAESVGRFSGFLKRLKTNNKN